VCGASVGLCVWRDAEAGILNGALVNARAGARHDDMKIAWVEFGPSDKKMAVDVNVLTLYPSEFLTLLTF
jgi:hypothetical protein